MLIQLFKCPPLDTNCYLVTCPKTRETVVIDPGFGSFKAISPVIQEKQLKLKAILLTHSHWDHIANVAEFKEHFKVPVYIHPLDEGNLINPGSDGIPMMYGFKGCNDITHFDDKLTYQLGTLSYSVIHTPGHARGSVCIYFPDEKVLFSGDTLFKGSIGNLSFSTCEPEKMWPSLRLLEKLPQDITIYPGHGPSTTLKQEMTWLPKAEEYFS